MDIFYDHAHLNEY